MKTSFNLSDEIRSEIRWSQSKRGYVIDATHARGPRGGRVRNTIRFAGTNEAAAHRNADELIGRRWSHPITDLTIYEVDALGVVQN